MLREVDRTNYVNMSNLFGIPRFTCGTRHRFKLIRKVSGLIRNRRMKIVRISRCFGEAVNLSFRRGIGF
jgi:hypothetical protein